MSAVDSDHMLYCWLESANLTHLHQLFRDHGIDASNFPSIPLENLDSFGITDASDRQQLRKLYNVIQRSLNQQPAQQQQPQQQPQQPAPVARQGGQRRSMHMPDQASIQYNNQQQQQQQQQYQPQQQQQRMQQPQQYQPPNYQPQQHSSSSSSSSQQYYQQPSLQQQQSYEEPQYEEYDDGGNGGGGGTDDEPDDDEVEASSTDVTVNEGWVAQSKIRVGVRKRPLNKNELLKGEVDIAVVDRDSPTLVIHEPKVKVDLTKYVECHEFIFDDVFNEEATNESIYATCCKPLINFFMNKGKATCFAYGQTGSGKTFTMMGPGGGKNDQSGLYVLACKDIFRSIERIPQYANLQVWVSFFEIYGGKLYDLLSDRKKLICREDAQKNVNIVGLTERQCKTADEVLENISAGNAVRATGSTGANADSSRSHAILQIVVKKMVRKGTMKPKLRMQGKFSFIDLAGSERAADTTNNDQRTRLEGAEINKSLLALKECIRALDLESKHLPFRGSQLTQVLKDSFLGNCRTVMLANVSPNSSSCEHTLNTLRYANRVKELKKGGGASINGQPSDPKSKDKSSYNPYMPHHQQKKPKKIYKGGIDLDRGDDNDDAEEVDYVEDDVTPTRSPPPEENVKPLPMQRAISNPVQQQQPQQRLNNNVPPPHLPQLQPNPLPSPTYNSNIPQPRLNNQIPQQQQQQQPQQRPQYNPPPQMNLQQQQMIQQQMRQGQQQQQQQPPQQQQPQYEPQYQDDVEQHNDLASSLLYEEESVVEMHRSQLDNKMKSIKEEMTVLKKFDVQGCTINEYIESLDTILERELNIVSDLRAKLAAFRGHLREEERLSSSFRAPMQLNHNQQYTNNNNNQYR